MFASTCLAEPPLAIFIPSVPAHECARAMLPRASGDVVPGAASTDAHDYMSPSPHRHQVQAQLQCPQRPRLAKSPTHPLQGKNSTIVGWNHSPGSSHHSEFGTAPLMSDNRLLPSKTVGCAGDDSLLRHRGGAITPTVSNPSAMGGSTCCLKPQERVPQLWRSIRAVRLLLSMVAFEPSAFVQAVALTFADRRGSSRLPWWMIRVQRGNPRAPRPSLARSLTSVRVAELHPNRPEIAVESR